MSRECHLVDFKGAYSPITLHHMKEIIVGRNPYCAITDQCCSREQLSVTADLKKKVAHVKHIGQCFSGVNGFKIAKGDKITVADGDYLEVVLAQIIYIVKFSPSDDKDVDTKFGIDCKDEIKQDQPSTSGSLKRTFSQLESKSEIGLKKFKGEEDISIKLSATNSKDQVKIEINATQSNMMEKIDNGRLYIFTSKGVISQSKIAAFDIDGTIIKTKSGNVFPKNADDWQIAFPEVPGKLKEYHASEYKIAFFTNQAGIGSGKITIDEFKRKIENIIARLGVPVQVFISSGKLNYRKPSTGMWDMLIQMKNDNLEVDIDKSFYCGDAAGRPKDHSMADRLFAENIGIPFSTPEAHFRGLKELAFNPPAFDPKLIDTSITNKDLTVKNQEIVVMVGFPGSGKSTISKQIEKTSKGKYKVICRDVLNSSVRCQSEAVKAIKNSQSVIVDSTNPDVDSRAKWLSLASKNGLPCRCFFMDVTLAHAQHNNKYRQLTDTTHSIVKDVIFNMYKSKFREPTLSEGFKEVIKINFTPYFNSELQKKLYFKHLLEK